MTATTRAAVPFADLDLARRLERAEARAGAGFVEARAEAFPDSGATWAEFAGAYAMFDGPDSPITQAFGLGVFEEAGDEVLDRIERFFDERGAPTAHEICPLAGAELPGRLRDRGYRPTEVSNVLYRTLPLEPLGVDARAMLPRVRALSPEEGALWADLSARGWSEHPGIGEYLRGLAPFATRRADARSYAVVLEDEPVAVGLLCTAGDVALLGGACTVPEARRRGAQRALFHARLGIAADEGCDLAMMVAEPGSASHRNAERRGFRVAYTRTKWVRAAGAA